jgi:NADPH:quinone reductase-like Zn-dependent oxidoreductase
MLAVRTYRYGGVEELRLEEVPTPEPDAGEVLVRIAAAAVNPIDWRLRSGEARGRLPLTFPVTLGGDFSGTVAALGDGVDTFQIGDEVYGYCGVQRDGAYAQYIALPAAHVARRPRTLSIEDSAAVPLGALTAHVALMEDAGLTDGQSVLIHAAAGGVGVMAVQLAKAAGAKVYATGSAASVDLITSLGADVVIDYGAQRFEDVARGMDVVLDGVGGRTQDRSWACLRPGGFMAAIVNPPDLATAGQYKCRAKRCSARMDGALLARFAAMVDAGRLRPVIDRVLPLGEVQQAHRLSEAGHSHGKIILRVP